MNIHPTLQIDILKLKLQETDYKAIKYSEGWLTDEEIRSCKSRKTGFKGRNKQA